MVLSAVAETEGEDPVADWASLFGDLSRPSLSDGPERGGRLDWRVHDKTHLEFAIDYPLGPSDATLTWEAYFFVPESFRLQEDTYDKKAIYDDLWSYVRYAVPQVSFPELARREPGTPLADLEKALVAAKGAKEGSPASQRAMRELRLFACFLRASGVHAMREAQTVVTSETVDEAEARAAITSFGAGVSAVGQAARKVLAQGKIEGLPEETRTAARWVDEDVSLVLESLSASLGVSVSHAARSAPGLGPLAEQLAAASVAEARHRKTEGYDSVGSKEASTREIEHLEFRRHVLKRFTASALWLSLEVHDAATWIVHTLYAVAAAVAMAFALAASVQATPTTENVFRYGLLVVVAYAVKDRMKAFLQGVFAGFVSRRFPDRSWRIRDHEAEELVGRVRERAGFLPFRSLPADVLAARRVTRTHPLEEFARPERVLWHQKSVTLPARGAKGRFSMLTEIFRLDVHRWLEHTDDPNRRIVFADPETSEVYAATARRVYNINVVYRLARQGAPAPWQRLRVVVSRKGIERIDAIPLAEELGKLT